MWTEDNTNIERIIAKIDNDFNPDNSDWIPRVGAWCIDGMSMINCVPTEIKTKTLKVKDRIAYSPIKLPDNIKVYDKNGCPISNLKAKKDCCSSHLFTGDNNSTRMSNTVSLDTDISHDGEQTEVAVQEIGSYYEKYDRQIFYDKHDVTSIKFKNEQRNYVLIDNNKIELNFDTDCITVEYKGIKTTISQLYCCELPVIPNNGLLIEALAYFCIYKMLCRGMKHPVFNLAASQYGTNPYFIWNQLKDKAKISIINDGMNEDVSKLFRSSFFISAFDPRR